MSAVGDVEADADGVGDPGLWTSFATALRLIVGWFSVAIGVLNLLAEVDRATGTPDMPYLLFHVMLCLGGTVLLAASRLGRAAGAAGCTAGATVAVAGLPISAIPATTTLCCVTAFSVRHGFPFTFAARNDGSGGWHIDGGHLLADLLFWAYAGLLVLVVVARTGPAAHPGDRPEARVTPATHAEHHAHAREIPSGATPADADGPPEAADRAESGPADGAHGDPQGAGTTPADTTATPAEDSTRGTVGGLP
jgi:hypothetical protein